MRLFLCRHGNTFNLGDESVWTGSTNDLPLVEKGEQQAHDVATWLRQDPDALSFTPSVIYASHLQRVKRFADLIKEDNGYDASIHHDECLNEIDYGSWTGISDQAVEEIYGRAPIDLWRQKSVFPAQGQWGETQDQVIDRINAFVEVLKSKHEDEDVLVVSSNGILRYFLNAFDPDLFKAHIDAENFQVKTGRMCFITYKENNTDVVFWNKDPNS